LTDLVSAEPTLFDGDVPGSYSNDHPERCFGRAEYIEKSGLVNVRWLEGDVMLPARLKDLQREKSAVTSAQIKLEARKWDDASVLVCLMEGEKIAFDVNAKEAWPNNFFDALARSDWREWVEAMKKELAGWDENNAVTLVDISEVPHAAKIVPLGELYTIKRCGKYKHRQCLMGICSVKEKILARPSVLLYLILASALSTLSLRVVVKQCGDGMQCVDVCNARSSTIFMRFCLPIKNIQVWNTKNWESLELNFWIC
jgi:hypothetical protein